ncbi:hypothetical protein C5C18_00820 [Rathayibacter tritici]|uniref:hypothetical protein n=1 Tax=Rathayibacter tritici TaxID=33888 RepID=UPI000CE82BB0|nr:hypothetical protein [Rathayibacter tritici]PPF30873.1 hypothetical protein C5C06_03665 [Rathayibacter tritici]PPF66375.1 hypothetical protein C5C21_09165 [Rathayibacter tritici]PPG09554.1 hypothetical protein C5C18_00820 [Rathayibacter tritici]PPI13634.1 hypothetical protein C5D07_09495 [Rathayibacter tritici]
MRSISLDAALAIMTVEGTELMRALDDGAALSLGELEARTGIRPLALARSVRTLSSAGVLRRGTDGLIFRPDRATPGARASNDR